MPWPNSQAPFYSRNSMKFTESHEWIEVNNQVGTVGITQFAQKELGEIVYVELPKMNKAVSMGQEVVVLESTKAAADVYSPVSGTIIEVNESLKEAPELINKSPENSGWIYKIRLSDESELERLMDDKAYKSMLKG